MPTELSYYAPDPMKSPPQPNTFHSVTRSICLGLGMLAAIVSLSLLLAKLDASPPTYGLGEGLSSPPGPPNSREAVASTSTSSSRAQVAHIPPSVTDDVFSFSPSFTVDVLTDVIHHTLGTGHTVFSEAGVHGGTAPVFWLHGEMAPTTVADAARTDLQEIKNALGLLLDESNNVQCDISRVPGFYVRSSCTPLQSTIGFVCSRSFELTCLEAGGGKLPVSRQYDLHTKEWVFSYHTSLTYLP